MPSYTPNKDLEALANTIIAEHRPNLADLKIAYVFRDEAPVSRGKVTAGMCRRVDDLNRTLHKYDMVIEISQDLWVEANDNFRRALMDHELGHVGIECDEEGDPIIDEKTGRIRTYCKRHDIEEFADVLERHGAYHKALREFLEAFARRKAKKKQKADEDGEEEPEDEPLDEDVNV